ncbi:cytochrome b5 domain-containing protein [Cavenderia fasciculata]|uniref:Cytochrome b5 domain-containing protein n=1 Tax=Cavenderia fasciculata TaxID=261658 RepID=F4QD96_CACFS|nr:cytochrome b5 domain-containing protein [Cavenderia fasciculata]EGG13724.1 cytochrome b5 domain-containing protein [Cavenderia fasciculata]|eukprot:XP_004350428.1 cytochrome b5 domain-containing protein [Cavenderia fasciculata]
MGLFDDVPEEVIWAILVGVIVYLVKVIWFPPPPPIIAKKKMPTYEKRDYTLEELTKYNGTNGTPIFVSIKGKIYDVSYKSSMYGPGGDYSLFAGHDATTCLAKSSFETKDLNRPITDTSSFSSDEMESLNGWVSFFDDRYDVVGHITAVKSTKSNENETSTSTTTNTTNNNTTSSTSSSTTSSTSTSSTSSDKVFTLEELSKYNGVNGNQIYVSVNGKVFDVSSKPEFYGPGKSYNLFAGHDATTCLGKNNLTKESLDKLDTTDFTPEQKANLEKWLKVYESKYPLVGSLSI